MYFEELSLDSIFRMRSSSRYLFLEFIETFSLILVANQGAYDMHLFTLRNTVDVNKNSKYKL